MFLLLVTSCSSKECKEESTSGTIVQKNSCQSEVDCGYKTCEKCNRNITCIWDKERCRKKGTMAKEMFTEKECPCTKCTEWYKAEKSGDMAWLSHLNENFKCPCRVNQTHSIVKWLEHLEEIDNPSNRTWVRDIACTANGQPSCSYYHPGANGCLRSLGIDKPSGAGQQCCYNKKGNILKAGSKGAGTPDRGHSLWHPFDHDKYDVKPFVWCCKDCKEEKKCNYYVNELRKGDTSHCPEQAE